MATEFPPVYGAYTKKQVIDIATNAVGIKGFSMIQVSITHPDPEFIVPVVGTGNQDLDPDNGGFYDILNGYSQVYLNGDAMSVLADGRVQFLVDGKVDAKGYADVSSDTNNSTAGICFSIERNGSTIYSARSVHSKMPNSGDIGHLSGFGDLDVLAGDIVGAAIASDKSGDISIKSSSLIFHHFG